MWPRCSTPASALPSKPSPHERGAHNRRDDALGHDSQNTSSPEGASELPKPWRRVAVKNMAEIQLGQNLPADKVAAIVTFLKALTGPLPAEFAKK